MSGATNCPETPRQKMIAMMYLVLTAMLALNVSAQILNGYTSIYESMTKSVQIAQGNNANLEYKFGSLKDQNPVKAKPMEPYVDSLVKESNDLYQYLDEFKHTLVSLVDGEEADKENWTIKNAGDLNIASELLEGKSDRAKDPDKKNWGLTMKEKLNAYSQFAQRMVSVGVVDTIKANSFKETFDTPDKKIEGATYSWEKQLLEDQPAIAVLATVTKLQNDVRNTEAECLNHIINQLDAGDFRVNKIQALAIADESYVLRGNKYRAKIVLAATDSTKDPVIEINGKPLEKDIYEFTATNLGKQKYKGNIKMKKPNGEEISYPFETEYVVGEPTATVSADMMNVLYAGFSNPISVSVPGVNAGDVSISVSNANITKTPKGWNVIPQKVGVNCDINVSANIGGKSTHMAKHSFRVKKLPQPAAMLKYNNSGRFYVGKIDKRDLNAADEVVAELPDADLNVKYTVLSFSIKSTDSMGNTIVEPAQGSKITEKQKAVFKKLVKGKTIYLSDVNATGPDKIKRILSPVEIALK
ncbi:MAG: gliding motility protein GldM [Bacteroidales bacterium]|nr:gliding motility protein GldM [Candidatus Scybalocola fimicaballi]